MAERLVLHIGPRKTGTTFLQQALTRLSDGLRAAGIAYVPSAGHNHVLAAADIAVETADVKAGAWPGRDGSAYRDLVAQVNAHGGTSIVSAELLGALRAPAAERFIRDFACPVDVLITARDLTRVMPSHWQQHIRNGGTQSFDELLEVREAQRLMRQAWAVDREHGFWRSYCYAELASRWAGLPGVRSVTIITVPASTRDSGELWRRFGAAADLDLPPDPPPMTDRLRNAGLGAAQTLLLTAENVRAFESGRTKREVVRSSRWLLRAFEAETQPSAPAVIPLEFEDAVRRWIAEDLELLAGLPAEMRATVVGDLADLRAQDALFGPQPTAGEVAGLAVRVLSRERSGRRRPAPPQPAPDA